MKAIRLTKAEAEAVRSAVGQWVGLLSTPPKAEQAAKSVLAKLDAAEAPVVAGVAAGPIENALVASSRGKVVPLVGQGGYGRASKQATLVGATVDDAKLIGAWLARTSWITGPKTVLDVLNQWSNWLTKATATAPPPAAPSGIGAGAGEKDADTRRGTAGTGNAPPGRLRAGFGR